MLNESHPGRLSNKLLVVGPPYASNQYRIYSEGAPFSGLLGRGICLLPDLPHGPRRPTPVSTPFVS